MDVENPRALSTQQLYAIVTHFFSRHVVQENRIRFLFFGPESLAV